MKKVNLAVSAGVLFGALALSAVALPAAPMAHASTTLTQTISKQVKYDLVVSVVKFNGKSINNGIDAWSSAKSAGVTKQQHNTITLRSSADADATLYIGGKAVWTGKVKANTDTEAAFDVPVEPGKVVATLVSQGKNGDQRTNNTLDFTFDWQAVLPPVGPQPGSEQGSTTQDSSEGQGAEGDVCAKQKSEADRLYCEHLHHSGRSHRGYRAPNTGYVIINGQAYSKRTLAVIAGAVVVVIAAVIAIFAVCRRKRSNK